MPADAASPFENHISEVRFHRWKLTSEIRLRLLLEKHTSISFLARLVATRSTTKPAPAHARRFGQRLRPRPEDSSCAIIISPDISHMTYALRLLALVVTRVLAVLGSTRRGRKKSG